MKPAIVIGSRTQGLAVIRALGAHGVPVVVLRYHRRDMGYGSRGVREVIDCAHPEHQPKRFIELLRRLSTRYPGALLVPPSDLTVAAVAEHQDMLTQLGFVVAAPDRVVVRTCLDKSATYAFARAHGVSTPATVPVHQEIDLERFRAEVGFPAVLKPKVSHRYKAVFGRKWTLVHNLDQALAHYRAAREAGLAVVAQELIPGDELCGANYNAYVWAGGFVEMTAAKIRNSPAETGSPSVVMSRKIPELIHTGRHLLSALGYRGFANIEFKRDPRDGVYKLIEINARHNLSAMLAIRCGISFPWLEYQHRICGVPPAATDYEQGVYWIDITRDLKSCLSYLGREDYSLWRFIRPYLSRPVFAVASWRDPRPAAIRGVQTLGQLRHAIQGKLAVSRSRPAGAPRSYSGTPK